MSPPRTYRMYQGVTAALLVVMFVMAFLFVGLVAVNMSGGPPFATALCVLEARLEARGPGEYFLISHAAPCTC